MVTYIKYEAAEATGGRPFAVIWLKKASEIVVGLALPDAYDAAALTSAPRGLSYSGLTKYFQLTPETEVPPQLIEWVKAAFEHARSRDNSTIPGVAS
jgi:hypothetical protein